MMADLTPVFIIGLVTLFVSTLVKVWGYPDQIAKNFKRKSTEGYSTLSILLVFLSYLLWTIYGWLQRDWVIIIGMSIGVLVTGIIIYQIFSYRKKS